MNTKTIRTYFNEAQVAQLLDAHAAGRLRSYHDGSGDRHCVLDELFVPLDTEGNVRKLLAMNPSLKGIEDRSWVLFDCMYRKNMSAEEFLMIWDEE